MKTFGILILSIILVAMTVATIPAATPDVPRLISYQGYLTETGGEPIADGAHVIQFFIWNDPALSDPGNQKWWSGVTSVTTTDGLFDVLLGNPAMNPINPDIFVDSNLWLGVVVGADPELSPRTKLTSTPYAFSARIAQTATEANHAAAADALSTPLDHASLAGLGNDDHDQYVLNSGDDLTGSLSFSSGGTLGSKVDQFGGHYTYDFAGLTNARMHGNNWGQIQLYDNQPGNVNTIEINAESGSGGAIIVRNASGSQTHRLYAGSAGNASVIFPNDAISADETLEEAGIARAYHSSIGLDGSVTNIMSQSITVPGPGYIVVRSTCYGQIYGTTIGNIIFYVATSPTSSAGDHATFGASDETLSSAEYRWGSLCTERTFAVGSAGTYTYYTNAYQGWTGGTAYVYDASMVMMYFPTNYGAVSTVVMAEEATEFDNVTAVQTTTGIATGSEQPTTVYSVDLQELVNKAKAARKVAEEAERELQEALKAQYPANADSEAGSENK